MQSCCICCTNTNRKRSLERVRGDEDGVKILKQLCWGYCMNAAQNGKRKIEAMWDIDTNQDVILHCTVFLKHQKHRVGTMSKSANRDRLIETKGWRLQYNIKFWKYWSLWARQNTGERAANNHSGKRNGIMGWTQSGPLVRPWNDGEMPVQEVYALWSKVQVYASHSRNKITVRTLQVK